jgi:hypothetical protein
MKKTLLSPPSNGSNSFQKFFALVLLIIGGSFSANAQVSSYVYSESTGNTYTPITGGTVVASNAVTAFTSIPAYATYTLPFAFYYNNIGYTTVSISDNGYIILGAVGTAAVTTTQPISSNTTNDSAIACYGANLASGVAPGTAEIRYELTGTAPNRVFVVQYKDMQRRPALVTLAGLMNMQIRLYEGTGVIETVYKDAVALSGYAGSSQKGEAGLRGAGNNLDWNARYNTTANFTPTAAVTLNNNSQVMTTGLTNTISAGTKFTWTPCFNLSSITAVTPDNSTLNISWTAPNVAPPGGYDWEVRTSGNPGSGGVAPALFASGNTSSNSVSVVGMSIGVTYYVYVKANCRSVWLPTSTAPSSVLVTPICTVASIPYTQNFEGVVVTANTNNTPAPNNTVLGGYPACNSLVTTSGASMGVTNNSTLGYYGFNNKNLITTGAAAQNAWYFTQVMNFASAGSYKLTYKYGGSREQLFFQQKMKVYYGAVASAAGMTTLLADHPDIKTSPETFSVNFYVSTPGTYYIGFNSYANASQGYLQLDDIVVDFSTCLPPTALTSGQVSSGSAVIAWNAPATSPGGGYQYYISQSATAPISTTTATASTTPGNTLALLSGLTPSTTYYYWVRSSCSATDVSVWSTVASFTTTAAIVYCLPSGASFAQDPNGITNVTMGSINNTTGIEANNYGDYSSLSTNVAQTTTVTANITFKTGFTYYTNIWVDWNNDGDFIDAGELVNTGQQSTNASPTTLTLTFVVPTLDSNSASTIGPHRVRIGGIDDPAFTGGALTPCRTGQYQAFEDYSIFVTVPPPALTLTDGTGSTSNTVCAGDNTSGLPLSLSSNPASYQVYTWTPQNGTITGNILNGDISFNPTETTTYILTASQTSGNFSSTTASYTVYVNPLPTPITVAPLTPVKCQSDPALMLVASGGVIPGFYTTVFNEDFNGATNTFTNVNNSVNGNVANSTWMTHTSPFTYGQIFSSNDNSQFYMSNSDSQGSVGTTNTELISPVFSLVGYTDATLSFWHYYRSWSSGVASVDVSIDGGTTYTTLPGASWSTVTQGTATGFVNVVLNLSAYIGQSNMKIRFNYNNAHFGWYWAIDNVKVYGSNTSFVYWSPTTGLWNDAAATIPYTGDTRATVYAAPGSTTTYTLEADSLEGCSSFGTTTVTVLPLNGGTTSGNQTLSCSTTATDITLSGYGGTITGWQYSTSPTFATGITAIANTTATLTALEIGTLTSTRYYRAVVVNGTCTAYSTISGIIVTKTTWTGTWDNGTPTSASAVEFQSAWPAGSGNISACSVLVSNGAVVNFGPGETLTVQGEVKVNPGSQLNFANTASLYQVLDVTNAAGSYNGNGGVISASNGNQGRISMTRTTPPIRLLDYTYWSTPVFNIQTLIGFSSLSPWLGFYDWNNITQAWNWTPPNTAMAPGKGYIIRAPETYTTTPAPWTGTFAGVPNSGTITTSILGSGTGQVNLIGNPYPSAIDANLFLTDAGNAAVTTGTMYFWTHNTDMVSGAYTGSDYATYNLLGPTAASSSGIGALPSRYVSVGTAFFMYGTAAGNATFKNSMRVPGNNTVFFKSNGNQVQDTDASDLERHRYWIDLKNDEGAFKEVLVGYAETATMGFDRLFDGDMIDVGNAVTLYTKVDDKKLSTQGRSLPFDSADLVPLSYTSTVAGNFTITMRAYDGLFTEQHVYLEDTLLNVIHDLTVSDYVFATEVGTFESRFVLRYTDGTLGTAHPNFDENSVVLYRNATGLHINSGAVNMTTVTIFDIRGREIATQKGIGSSQTTFTTLPEAHQVLLVKITAENGKTVTKKVVY